jgi:hypothetical protein
VWEQSSINPRLGMPGRDVEASEEGEVLSEGAHPEARGGGGWIDALWEPTGG